MEDSKEKAEEEAKLKLSEVQSDCDGIESKLSVVEGENLSLKSKNKSLVAHLSSTKEQARQKVQPNLDCTFVFILVSGIRARKG